MGRKRKFTIQNRASGILLHPSSLPGPHGIGDLGMEAYRFVDFLHRAGQRWWQMFPLGPEGFGHSPYQTLSVFAGNALLISLDLLEKDGLLSKKEMHPTRPFPQGRVDFDRVQRFKDDRLKKAFDRFQQRNNSREQKDFSLFCSKNKKWLEDYALFRALRRSHNRAPWWEWEKNLKLRKPKALHEAKRQYHRWFKYHQFLQYQFFKQWEHLKDYSHKKGVGIIGDVPIFVAEDSADVWSQPKLFYLNKDNRPTVVAGVPPDYFSKTGQRWGNPLYRWDAHKRNGYKWWIDRLQMAFRLFDVVRLDHFIGFTNYWAIPVRSKTARTGKWKKGPGADFFKKVIRKIKDADFIAEDLGMVTPQVKALRDQFRFPGMKVLQFAFGNDPEADNFRPSNYPKNSVVYTGTHDNDTIIGWFKDTGSHSSTQFADDIKKEREVALTYLNSNGKEIHWDMIRLALSSAANTALFPAQDVLGLGSEARMNRPGSTENNWVWRMKPGALTPKIANRLKTLTNTYGRMNGLSHSVMVKTKQR